MNLVGTAGQKVVRALGVRADERRNVGLLALIFGLGEAGRALGMNASDALFLVRFGVERLPWLYIVLGALTSLAVVLYAAGLARFRWRFLHPLYWIVALLLIIERSLIPLGTTAVYPALWLSVQVFSWVLVTAGWGLASQSFDTRQAKRLFSLFASASILGSIIGHATTAPLADWIGTENLFLVHSLLLLTAYLAVRQLMEGLPVAARGPEEQGNPLSDLMAGVRVLRRSRLLQLIFVSSILFSVLFFSVWFPFNKTVSAAFTREATLAGFLGNFTSVVMFSTLLLSLLSSRIYARFGIVNVILLVPLIYLAGFGLWLVEFSLLTAIALRFAQMVWINGAGWTAWNALFNVYHSDRREQLRAFESGVPSQIGTSFSGVLLLLGERVLTNQQIFLLGASTALLCALVCWGMRPAYGRALLRAIKSGLIDVFTGSPGALGRLGADAQARATALTALDDDNPSVRRIAATLLGRMDLRDPGPLITRLTDEAAPVRLAAVESLRTIDIPQIVDALRPLLEDESVEVRQATVRNLGALKAPFDGWVERGLRDKAPSVRAEAAAALSAGDDSSAGRQVLVEMLAKGDDSAAVAALRVANERGITLPLEELAQLVRHPGGQVRQLAVRALGEHQDGQAEGLILEALGDPDERVRTAATASAPRAGVGDGALFERLKGGSADAQAAALVALQISNENDRQELISWTLEQLHRLDWLQGAAARLQKSRQQEGRDELILLCDLVERRRSERTELILEALKKLAPAGAIQLVERGLSSGVRELQTQALEALETIGERRVVRGFLPLLEGEPTKEDLVSLDQVLSRLCRESDPWMRAFALRLRAERLRSQLQELEANVADDQSRIVRELWGRMPRSEGAPMSETMDTLSTMDRMLYLRQIPILDDLDPDDLHRIAEIAGERTIPEGGYLCREGELEDGLFLIVDGHVVITKEDHGRQKELRRLGPGHPVGELAILAQQPRSATVQAINGNVRVLVIGGKAFQAILRDRPAVSTALLANLARRLSAMV